MSEANPARLGEGCVEPAEPPIIQDRPKSMISRWGKQLDCFALARNDGFTLAEGTSYRTLLPTKVKFAFTLAEVLITLGIIGVVAAMTIPTLMNNLAKRQLEQQIKVAYSSIQQTMRFADEEGFGYDAFKDDDEVVVKDWFDNFIAKHMKVENYCINKQGCWHKQGVTKMIDGSSYPWDRANTFGGDALSFTTPKGAYYNLDGFSAYDCRTRFGIDNGGTDCLVINFDANGPKKPNVFGKDIHSLVYTEAGVVPAGRDKTKEERAASCRDKGYMCLAEIIENGWEIPSDIWKLSN